MAKKVIVTYEKKNIRRDRHKKRMSKSEKRSYKKYNKQGRRP